MNRCKTIASFCRRMYSAALALPVLGLVISLAGCRLYEPPRYTRLSLPPGAAQTRVLMIGDSLTYYNDLPGLLQQFSAGEAAPILIEQRTFPLRSLQGHLDVDDSVERIREGHFEYVILQDFSDKPVTNLSASLASFVRFDEEVKRAGSKTVIFQNWIHKGQESTYEPMVKAYAQIVERTHGTLAPIGTAWHLCATDRPDIALLIDDRHPTDAGTYLTACVLYDVLYHKKSAELPQTIQGPKLPANVMQTLRSMADRAVAGQ